MFDITKFRASDTAIIELKNGDGSPLVREKDVPKPSITIYGPGSDQWQEADAERSRARVAIMEKKAERDEVQQKLQDIELRFLADITASLNHFEYPGEHRGVGDMALALYSDAKLGFIRDQISGEAGNWSAFTKGSAIS